MFKRAVERYKAPTPAIYEIWGDILLTASAGMTAVLVENGADGHWIILNAFIGVLGRLLPKFAVLQAAKAGEAPTEQEQPPIEP